MPCLLNNTLTHSSAQHHDDVFCLDNISIIKDKHKYMYVTRRNMFEGRTLINPSIANRERSEPIQELWVDLILCTEANLKQYRTPKDIPFSQFMEH